MPYQSDAHWQAVLQKIIQPSKERQRLAAALGVNTITLTRWAKGDSRPQHTHLIRLLKVVQPHNRDELLEALMEAYPDMQEKLQEETFESISSAFFRQILRDRSTIIETLRPWQISGTVIDEGIRLLDPNTLGMAITPVLCMPPVPDSTGQLRIRSLHERGGRGVFPWHTDLEHTSIFLGMNSLAGYVVQNNRPASVRDVSKERYIPVFAYPVGQEVSAAACPIWLEGKVAGCLMAVSTQVEHFTQTRMDLLLNLTSVFSLALNPGDFYDHRLVQLRYIPHPRHQLEPLKNFRQLVNRLMTESTLNNHPLSSAQAERRAWQELEEILLKTGQELDIEEDMRPDKP